MSIKKIIILTLIIVFIAPVITLANLEESLSKAKSRESFYKQQYSAAAPMFKADNNGKVIWECWAAPPREWSESEAMSFARVLLPASIKSESPKKGTKDGTYYPYNFSDGTMIILAGFGGKYFGVEVRASGYSGPRC